MGSESNSNHSDNLRSSISGIINLRTLVVWSRRPLVLLSCQLVVELPVIELPLVISSLRHLVFSPCLSSSSRCTTLSLSHCAGLLLLPCLSLRCLLVLLSPSHCAAISPSHRAVWLLRRLLSRRRLVLLSSSYCATISSSCAGWLLCCLSLHCPLVLSSCCPLVLSLCAG